MYIFTYYKKSSITLNLILLQYLVMMYISIKPKPQKTFAEMFGQSTVHKFLQNFSNVENDEICIDGLTMMTFSKNLL